MHILDSMYRVRCSNFSCTMIEYVCVGSLLIHLLLGKEHNSSVQGGNKRSESYTLLIIIIMINPVRY